MSLIILQFAITSSSHLPKAYFIACACVFVCVSSLFAIITDTKSNPYTLQSSQSNLSLSLSLFFRLLLNFFPKHFSTLSYLLLTLFLGSPKIHSVCAFLFSAFFCLHFLFLNSFLAIFLQILSFSHSLQLKLIKVLI